ncbi:YczE/YyaS/YitT family protein [Bacillus sp. Marseille-P3661]|uniref:YczE/YyaS/YitT family protein n=1 Tax=Bacillus sp. Marseille-P3661 TaxID=1936234 RepID=UPI000C818B07|nr:YitT family protein [Bacillus sp. Marseille-P3661]
MGKRIAIYLLGLSITALGIALIVLSMAGAGPWDIVAVGLNNHFGLTIGTWSIIAQTCVVLLTGIIEKKRPPFESVGAIIIRSLILDGWIYLVFNNVDFTSSLEFQWISFTIGVLASGLGIGIYVLAEFPKTPIDGLMVAVHKRFGYSLNVSRTIIEAAAVVLGYLLGGPVGIGTLIIALTLGKVIQVSNQGIKKVFCQPDLSLSKSS